MCVFIIAYTYTHMKIAIGLGPYIYVQVFDMLIKQGKHANPKTGPPNPMFVYLCYGVCRALDQQSLVITSS